MLPEHRRTVVRGKAMRPPRTEPDDTEPISLVADGEQLAHDEPSAERADHDDATDWVLTHPEMLVGYSDEWVAVVGHEVVAHGPSLSDALRAARERGHDDPLLVLVTPPDVIFID